MTSALLYVNLSLKKGEIHKMSFTFDLRSVFSVPRVELPCMMISKFWISLISFTDETRRWGGGNTGFKDYFEPKREMTAIGWVLAQKTKITQSKQFGLIFSQMIRQNFLENQTKASRANPLKHNWRQCWLSLLKNLSVFTSKFVS